MSLHGKMDVKIFLMFIVVENTRSVNIWYSLSVQIHDCIGKGKCRQPVNFTSWLTSVIDTDLPTSFTIYEFYEVSNAEFS